jgi:hypothetical protein
MSIYESGYNYTAEQQRLIFDVYPNHGDGDDGRAGWDKALSVLADRNTFVCEGFTEVEVDRCFKRTDNMGRVVYIEFDGKALQVKHCYLGTDISSSFRADSDYARAVLKGHDNAYLFFNFGPGGE